MESIGRTKNSQQLLPSVFLRDSRTNVGLLHLMALPITVTLQQWLIDNLPQSLAICLRVTG